MRALAIFGPTAVGKTGVAIEVADRLRERGEDPVAISCDSIQVYRGLEILSGSAGRREQARLEHRLLGVVGVDEEFSAGRFAKLAHAEIDRLLAEGRRPIVVGGTGLYMRAALSQLELRPPVPSAVRAEIEADLDRRGAATLHAELAPELASGVHPNDRKRIVRALELEQSGAAPHPESDQLWSEDLRRPTALFGITMDREALAARIDARAGEMLVRGAVDEVERALERGASRTARKALGFKEIAAHLSGEATLDDVRERIERGHRAYVRRQLTWMRKLSGVEVIDRTDLSAGEVAERIAS